MVALSEQFAEEFGRSYVGVSRRLYLNPPLHAFCSATNRGARRAAAGAMAGDLRLAACGWRLAAGGLRLAACGCCCDGGGRSARGERRAAAASNLWLVFFCNNWPLFSLQQLAGSSGGCI
eukprot:s2552_g4.t1